MIRGDGREVAIDGNMSQQMTGQIGDGNLSTTSVGKATSSLPGEGIPKDMANQRQEAGQQPSAMTL